MTLGGWAGRGGGGRAGTGHSIAVGQLLTLEVFSSLFSMLPSSLLTFLSFFKFLHVFQPLLCLFFLPFTLFSFFAQAFLYIVSFSALPFHRPSIVLLSVTAMLGLMSPINHRAMGMHPLTLSTAKAIEVKRQGPDLSQYG